MSVFLFPREEEKTTQNKQNTDNCINFKAFNNIDKDNCLVSYLTYN